MLVSYFYMLDWMSLSVGESSFSCTELCRGWTGREKEIVEHISGSIIMGHA